MGPCGNCGSEVPDGARICPTCGSPVGSSSKDQPSIASPSPWPAPRPPDSPPSEITQPVYASKRTDGMAIASMVCGVLGISFFPVVLSIVAIVLGKQSRDRIDASDGALNGRQFANAGFILGIVGVVLGVLAIVVVLVLFGATFGAILSGELRL